MNNIVMIPVEQLHHHPENPRLELGDLTELAESIRKNGVMQNRTVVPEDPHQVSYLVVIGNRRMEAAKLAGLAEVPCVISDMDHKTQIATMLEENMQRSDLTPYEQAQGFQMMMDLGFTEKEIGEKTGFSEKTVKDRLKLTQFNKKKFESAVQQGATLMELVEISRIENRKDQDALLDVAGTNNFRQMMNEKLQDQEHQKNIKRLTPVLKEFAEELPENADIYGMNPDYSSLEKIADLATEKARKQMQKLRKDNPEDQLFYKFSKYWNTGNTNLMIYKKNRKVKKELSEEEKSERQKQLARNKHLKAVKEYWARAYQLRRHFIRNYTITVNGTSMTNISKLILKYALRQRPSWGTTYNHQWDKTAIVDYMGIVQEEYEDKHATVWELLEGRQDIPQIRAVLAWIVGGGVFWPDNAEFGLYNTWDGSWSGGAGKGKDNGVSDLYEFLTEIGYQMSDMEKQLMDGTHPIYKEGAEA